MDPKVSVIVPVYNVEKYHHRCIDSILTQTFTDFEVLLINDGSKDRSGEICDEYAKKDSRVKVFHKENGGVSSARNVGLDNAKGEWVTFCDSDDKLLLNAFETFLSVSNECDIVKTGYEIVDGNGNIRERILCKSTSIISDKSEIFRISEQSRYCGFLWNTFLKKNVIGDMRFDNAISWCEDHIFIYSVINKASTVGFVAECTYCYYIDDSKETNLSRKHYIPSDIVYAAKLERKVKNELITSNQCLQSLIETQYEIKIIKAAVESFHLEGIYKTVSFVYKETKSPFKVFKCAYVQFLKEWLKNKFKH